MSRKVQMLVSISGGRPNGPWPVAGQPLTVEDWEADHLIRGGLARPWPGEDSLPVPAAAVPAVTEPAAAQAQAGTPAAVPSGPAATGTEGTAAGPPKPFAPKQAWIDWAIAKGAAEEEASALTKAELQEIYGGRA